jgi:glycogen operon protein
VAHAVRLTLNQLLDRARIDWHGVALDRPDWSEHSHSLAFTLRSVNDQYLMHAMLNAYWEPLTFELPPVPEHARSGWRRCLDTALASPDDINPFGRSPAVTTAAYVAHARSVVLLALALHD